MTLEADIEQAENRRIKHPAGWEPYIETHGDQIGEAIVRLPTPGATARDLLISAGFDPDSWRIKGLVNTRKWMRYDGEWLYYYKFDVVAGESPEAVQVHVDDLEKLIRRRGRWAKRTVTGGDDAWAFFISDLQIGKREDDIGTPEIVSRYLETLDMAVDRIRELRRIGRRMPHGAVVGLGDIVEGCTGNYPKQRFIVDCNDRDQNRIARELITATVDRLSPLFERFTVACVAGNHGENRQNGDQITDDADNRDVSCFEAVAEAFGRAGSEIDWIVPNSELAYQLPLGGANVAIAHGHKFERARGGSPAMKAIEWWKGQDFGYGSIRDSQILVTGHFHHFLVTQRGRRTHIQVPAMDPGSKWFSDTTGEQGLPGVLTLRFDGTTAMGYDDLKLLVPTQTASTI